MEYKLLLLLALLTLGCYKNEPIDVKGDCEECKECEEITVIDGYIHLTPKEFDMVSYKIDNNCLRVVLSYAGCKKADVALHIVRGNVFETSPPQRHIWFIFSDVGDCEMKITEEYRFRAEDLQTEGNIIILNIDQTNKRITYKY